MTTNSVATSTTDGPFALASLPGRVAVHGAGCASNGAARMQICIMDPDGSDLVVVDAGENAGYPGWSNDGSQLYFVDDPGTMLVDADGSNVRVRRAGDPAVPGASPDGRWFVYTPYGATGFWIAEAATEGSGAGQQIVATSTACCQIARWSPDSRSLVYTELPSDDCAQLWVVDVATRERRQLTGDGVPGSPEDLCVALDSGRWSPTGDAILFSDDGVRSGEYRAYLIDPAGGEVRPLLAADSFADPEWMVGAMAWSPDGAAVMVSVVAGVDGGLFVVETATGRMIAVDVAWITAGIADIAWAPGL